MAIKWLEGEKKGKVEFEGAVLEKYDVYRGFDRYTDYVRVWDGRAVRTLEVGDGYCTLTHWLAEVTVDATDEIRKVADKAKQAAAERGRIISAKIEAERRAKIEAETVHKYDDVVVFKGRKIPVGTEGRVFWMDLTRWGWSVGIETKDGDRLFTALSNVKRKN